MVKRPAFYLALLLCGMVAVHACTGSPQEADDAFKIGIITSLTGSAAAFGQAHKNGYTIALNELNGAGGVLGKKIELVYYDDQSRPDQAVQGVNKLVDQDHVPIILGAYSSENTRAIVPAVTQKQIPLVMPTATADNVLETGSPWVFRICAGSSAYATATVDFLKAMNAPKSVAIVYENTNFGQSNAEAMDKAARAAGFDVVDSEAYQASSPDYKALLQRVKSRNPSVIYFASYLLDASTLMRQASQTNLNPQVLHVGRDRFRRSRVPHQRQGRGPVCRIHVLGVAMAADGAVEGLQGIRRCVLQADGNAPGLSCDASLRGTPHGDGRDQAGELCATGRNPRQPESDRPAGDTVRADQIRRARTEPSPGPDHAGAGGRIQGGVSAGGRRNQTCRSHPVLG